MATAIAQSIRRRAAIIKESLVKTAMTTVVDSYQRGRHNIVGIAQFGAGHTAITTQDGHGNAIGVIQAGHGNSANVTQVGRGNVSVIVQD